MRILQVAWKQLKHDFRDIQTFAFMIALPIVLIFILGTALTNAFDNDISVGEMTVLYESPQDAALATPFAAFRKGVADEGVHFKKVSKTDAGKRQVEDGNADGLVQLDGQGIHLFVNEAASMKASVLQGMFATFVDEYKLGTVLREAGVSNVHHTGGDFVQEQALQAEKSPNSIGYYAIVMTTMIALYAAVGATHLMTSERSRHTANRLLITPIRKSEIFTGKLLGSIAINVICIVCVILFSKWVFHANWGDHWGLTALILLTEIILAISVGLGLSFIIKSPSGPTMVIMVAIQLASFLGGAYFPIENAGKVLKFFIHLSPLTLENKAMFNMIYANDISSVLPAIGMNIGLAVIFLFISILFLHRREGL